MSRIGKEVRVTFRDIAARPLQMKANSGKSKGIAKPILKGGISGVLEPGKLTAIMGSSGAGKSTLLSILSGRAASIYKIAGKIEMNGEPATQEMLKTLCAFVMQDDIMLPYLTVREQVEFYARFGLPKYTAEAEIQKRVDDVLEELELVKCKDTKVGAPGIIRGISGGERKRTAIAMELVGDPSILFLDEPTSGLDSEIAFQVLQSLKKISSKGRTIAFSIHQPSSDVFALFDNLILLCDGYMVYNGPAATAVEHFMGMGYRIAAKSNPADAFLRIMHYASELVQFKGSSKLSKVIVSSEDLDQQVKNSAPGTEELQKLVDAAKAFKVEEMKSAVEDSPLPKEIKETSKSSLFILMKQTKLNKIGWTSQLKWLTVRSTKQFFRNSTTILRIVRFIFIALFASIVYQNLQTDTSGIQGRTGFLFSFLLQFSFIISNGVVLMFPLERPVFVREQAKSMYHPFWYLVAKSLTEAPVVIACVFVSLLISFFITGLRQSVQAFFQLQLVYILQGLLGQSIGMIVGAAVADVGKGMELSPSLLIPQMLVGGLLFNVNDIPIYLRWFEYISIFRYAYEAVLRAEFQDRDLPASIFAPSGNGNEVLEYFNFEWSYGFCVGMMVFFLVVYRAIAFFFLWRTSKTASPV